MQEEYQKFIISKLDEIKALFEQKNNQYAGLDPLENFRKAACLDFGCADYSTMYTVLRGYELKHIAYVFGQRQMDDKTIESLKDIVLYSLISMFMIEKRKGEARIEKI